MTGDVMLSHEGHNIIGDVDERVSVNLNVVEGVLEPDWGRGEEMVSATTVTAHCLDCDVWLISEEVEDADSLV